MARVVIMQPYVPAYRVAFFAALAQRLQDEGHELVVASGAPTGTQAKREDAAEIRGAQQLRLRVRTLRLGAARVRVTRGRPAWRHADIIITELAAGASATYGALLQRRRPIGVWGHVGAYTAPDTRITRALRRWQARRASHVLAYTDTGAAIAEGWGINPAKITTLHNTIDVEGLSLRVERVRAEGSSRARRRLGIGDGPVFAMIGGLDESKRIDLAIETLDLLWESRPDIRFVVGGRGVLEPLFARAVARGQARLLGYVADDVKADIANVAIALLNPGRVGLIAVESMAMGLPIVMAVGALHGPEYEYLSPGSDCIECVPTALALASAITELSHDSALVSRLTDAISSKAASATLDRMVDRYMMAVEALIDDSSLRRRSIAG